jgi:hypothetical protein
MSDKVIAYMTSDRKMLIFADSPNMIPEDKSGLIPLFEDNTRSCDRAYVFGLKHGYGLGQYDNESEFQKTVERYQKHMRKQS